MSNLNGLKVLALFEAFAVGGALWKRMYQKQKKGRDIVSVVQRWEESGCDGGGGMGKGGKGHCFKKELSLHLKQCTLSAATIS